MRALISSARRSAPRRSFGQTVFYFASTTIIFGVNGRHILDGLVAGVPREEILASRSRHVQRHHGTLCDTLSHGLTPRQHFLLQDQLLAFDRAECRIAEYDAVITEGLAEYRTQANLRTTIPSVPLILAERGVHSLCDDRGIASMPLHGYPVDILK